MRKVLMLLPLLVGVAATPAYAEGVTGRIELKVGHDEPRVNFKLLHTEPAIDLGYGDVAVGVEGGVDAHLGTGFLVGAYAGADYVAQDDCKSDLIFTDDELCLDAGRNLYAGLRAGLLVGDGGLIYVKGGYSNGKFKMNYFDGEDVFIDNESDSVGGMHFGAGFEVNVARNIYAKGEYIHTSYKNGFTDVLTGEQHADFTRHQIMLGVGMRFGGAPAAAPIMVETPPPPVAAPATQTCADGTVVLATDPCPAAPVTPTPPPPSSGERG